ncbi:MAG: hypothetical protein LBQ24_00505 [Candidatus Peribacteria bacterium]|nr:hypothetical protein [Candidatus Peribacteria bacterium]
MSINSIILSNFRTITSISVSAEAVAVLVSSFKSAISQNISHGFISTIFFHQMEIETLHLFMIYHSQFDFSHSTTIIFH